MNRPNFFDQKSLEIFNLAQEIACWTENQDWGDDWVIGDICSRKGYEQVLKENAELKEKIAFFKKIAREM